MNAEAVLTKSARSAGELREAAEASFRGLTDAVLSMSDEEWSAKAFYETERRTRLGNLLGSVTGASKRPFGHVFAHLPDLKAYSASLATNA